MISESRPRQFLNKMLRWTHRLQQIQESSVIRDGLGTRGELLGGLLLLVGEATACTSSQDKKQIETLGCKAHSTHIAGISGQKNIIPRHEEGFGSSIRHIQQLV